MKKNNILGITAASIISIGMLSGCGNAASTEQKNENTSVTEETTIAEDTTVVEETTEVENATSVENEDVVEGTDETSFGLKDYEGLYCYTGTDEIEDYEVTYTWGYQLNGDGTGVSYIQDVIDFTWNETEMHYADRTESFKMEPGKLTVGDMDIVFEKIDGNFITPNPCDVDVDNIANGIYHAYMGKNDIKETDGKYTIWTNVFTEDSYDIVDINRMAEGDVIYINELLLPVKSVDKTDSGIININGGIENNGSALIADDESNCFVYAGMDMERSYTNQGVTTLAVSDDVKLIDRRNPSEEKEYTGSDAISVLKELVEEEPLNRHNCSIMVENGEIIEITRLYTP